LDLLGYLEKRIIRTDEGVDNNKKDFHDVSEHLPVVGIFLQAFVEESPSA
jgi:hypothetical protein